MSDLDKVIQSDHYGDAPIPGHRPMADAAIRSVTAGRVAAAALLEVASIAHVQPDTLADRLLALLASSDAADRSDVVCGFLRPIQKHLEANAAALRKTTASGPV